MGDLSPAWCMVGTLIGLVLMLAGFGGEGGAEGLRGDHEELRGQAVHGLEDDRGEGGAEGGGRGAAAEGEAGARGFT